LKAKNESGKLGLAVFELYYIKTAKHEETNLQDRTETIEESVRQKLVFVGGADQDHLDDLFDTISEKNKD